MHDRYKKIQLAIRRGSIRLAGKLIRGGATSGLPADLNTAKILFLRQNQIGDALVSTPVFSALKQHYPGITLDVLLNRRNARVFDNDPDINRIQTIKLRRGDVFSVLRDIRAQRYDAVVDLVHSPSTTSSIFCLLSKAGVTIGPRRENDFAYGITVDPVHPQRAGTSSDSMARRLMQTLIPFGINPEHEVVTPRFHLTPEAMSLAGKIAARARKDDPLRPLFAINIAGSKAEKYWGTDRFIALINRLKWIHPNAAFVLLYSPDYVDKAGEIAVATDAHASGGTPTLTDFAATICACDALISPDSAAVHFADIFNVPVVTLVLDPPENRLWLPSVTRFRSLHANNKDIQSISVDDVAAAFNALIETRAHARPENKTPGTESLPASSHTSNNRTSSPNRVRETG